LKINGTKLKIFGLYFFLLAGGLWHILDVLQTTMNLLAGPVLIGLAIWLCYEFLSFQENQSGSKSFHKSHFLLWALLVVAVSFSIETIGVKTGKIFGVYGYGDILWPQIAGVPIAIGFAWLLMMLSSTAFMQRLPAIKQWQIFPRAVVIAVLMTYFDFMMEPAAIKLGYWTWASESVPLQNYLAWFILSFVLAFAGNRVGLFDRKQPALAVHAYFAQLIYFIMIFFK
jgi:uncharacterized membrane protein